MSRKIILLFDSPVGDDHFLYRALKQEGLTVRKVDSPSRYPSILNWAIGCMKATFGPQATDTIVCWYDFQAVLCYWIGRFLFRKRNIVAINILLKDKKTLRNKIVAWFYKKALTSSHMAASVTARAYGDSLNERFCTNICFFRVRDVYSPTLYEESDFRFCGNSVFAGDGTGGTGKPSSRRPAGCRMSYSMLSCRKISRRNSGANRFPISTYTAIFPRGIQRALEELVDCHASDRYGSPRRVDRSVHRSSQPETGHHDLNPCHTGIYRRQYRRTDRRQRHRGVCLCDKLPFEASGGDPQEG